MWSNRMDQIVLLESLHGLSAYAYTYINILYFFQKIRNIIFFTGFF